MGLYKNYEIEVRERGWWSTDKAICIKCVGDAFISQAVAVDLDARLKCSFCSSCRAVPFDTFMAAFMVGVTNEYEQVDNAAVPYDSAEGGYHCTTVYDSWEVVDHFDWVASGVNDVAVSDAIRESLVVDAWARRYWATGEPGEAYGLAWQQFCHQIMHRTRFVFWASAADDEAMLGAGEIAVRDVLERIGGLLKLFELISTLPAGTTTRRVRGHAEPATSAGWRAADLGTNLPERSTTSSRMSPAGIPLFYGSDDLDTALAEVAKSDPREYFTAALFRTTQPMTVIDLTALPEVPSVFDPEFGRLRGEIVFLHNLVEKLRQPVDADRTNLDYLPTQVFTEYFLRVFDADDAPVKGLVYRSALTESRCVALEIAHDGCVDRADDEEGRPQLELVPDSVTVHRRRSDEFRQL